MPPKLKLLHTRCHIIKRNFKIRNCKSIKLMRLLFRFAILMRLEEKANAIYLSRFDTNVEIFSENFTFYRETVYFSYPFIANIKGNVLIVMQKI